MNPHELFPHQYQTCLYLISLQHRKEQWRKEEEDRIANIPDPSIPPGHTQMAEDERQQTLDMLKKCKRGLLRGVIEVSKVVLWSGHFRWLVYGLWRHSLLGNIHFDKHLAFTKISNLIFYRCNKRLVPINLHLCVQASVCLYVTQEIRERFG